MIHGGFRHLPVLDGGTVVGIVAIRDLMRVALEDSAPRGVQLPRASPMSFLGRHGL
jgi:CBS domain-containing protein